MTQLSAPSTPLDYAPRKSGMRFPKWLVPGFVVLGVVFLLGSILLPSMCKSRETANRVKCASNMKQIGNALMMFANEHGGKYPDKLSDLVATEGLTTSVFVCPSSSAESSTATTPDQIGTDLADPKYCSYVYVKENAGKEDKAVLYEALDDHEKVGMSILFGDGHCDFFQTRSLNAAELATIGLPVSAVPAKQ